MLAPTQPNVRPAFLYHKIVFEDAADIQSLYTGQNGSAELSLSTFFLHDHDPECSILRK
jgi:hypothetical protein